MNPLGEIMGGMTNERSQTASGPLGKTADRLTHGAAKVKRTPRACRGDFAGRREVRRAVKRAYWARFAASFLAFFSFFSFMDSFGALPFDLPLF